MIMNSRSRFKSHHAGVTGGGVRLALLDPRGRVILCRVNRIICGILDALRWAGCMPGLPGFNRRDVKRKFVRTITSEVND